MTKTWIYLICKRAGDEATTLSGAQMQHDSQQKGDEALNLRMQRMYPGFAGPMTNCRGDIRLAPQKPKRSAIVPQSGKLGGDEPWI